MSHITHYVIGNVARYRLCYWKCCMLHTNLLEMSHVTHYGIGNVARYTLRYWKCCMLHTLFLVMSYITLRYRKCRTLHTTFLEMSHVTYCIIGNVIQMSLNTMQSEMNYSFNTKFCCTEKPWQDTRCSSGTCSTASMWRGCSVMCGSAIKQLISIHCTLLNGETKYVFWPWIVYLQVNIF